MSPGGCSAQNHLVNEARDAAVCYIEPLELDQRKIVLVCFHMILSHASANWRPLCD